MEFLLSYWQQTVRVILMTLTLSLTQNVFAKTLLVVGDSLSAGYGLDPAAGWVNQLAERLKAHDIPLSVANISISGETSAGALRRLPSALAKYTPTIVLIELGANDGLQGLPLKLLEQNLRQMILLCKQQGALPVLFTMHIPPNYGKPYTTAFSQLFSTLSQEQNIPLMPFFLEGVAGNPEFIQADGLHPNQAAQPIILKNVWTVLAPLIKQQLTIEESATQ
ncbi:arylesterase [Zooshikella ganghwensis]|uniref:arylesterase n=1 Tax=Zooshikella ganghwensis TaxID=202772 RepID=UPI001F4389BD|nr:arylesterase [Zooshikella ganghwensis]